ncbi:MAG: hypothetical protein IT480_15680 [Gammaproteobacteria bacterium]|nr:hypothetical protein [Gammaproteobacteria bacterium]
MWHYENSALPAANRYLPSRQLTMAGLAREEAGAYRFEAGEIQKMVDELERKCELRFSGASLSCTIPMPGTTIEMGQTVSGRACGDPVSSNWMFSSESWIRPGGGSGRDEFTGECVAKGSPIELAQADVYRRAAARATRLGGAAGWLCVYDETNPDQITIRNFRMAICSPNAEQIVTVEVSRSSECGASSSPQPTPQPEPPPPSRPVS